MMIRCGGGTSSLQPLPWHVLAISDSTVYTPVFMLDYDCRGLGTGTRMEVISACQACAMCRSSVSVCSVRHTHHHTPFHTHGRRDKQGTAKGVPHTYTHTHTHTHDCGANGHNSGSKCQNPRQLDQDNKTKHVQRQYAPFCSTGDRAGTS